MATVQLPAAVSAGMGLLRARRCPLPAGSRARRGVGGRRALSRPFGTLRDIEVEPKDASREMNTIGRMVSNNGTDGLVLIDRNNPQTSIFSASKTESVVVLEGDRPLAEYMALPASQYSVLDAKRIERIDEDTFRCYIGGISFLGFVVDPVITVSVTPGERGCVVRLLACRLEGNKVVEAANSRFNALMVNQLEWQEVENGDGEKQIVSNMMLEVVLTVPRWFLLPPATISATGSKVMQQVVNKLVPRFLAQLREDYALWASGDESRKPIGDMEAVILGAGKSAEDLAG